MPMELAERILVVDDDSGSRESCCEVLRAHGFLVDKAASGEAAYQKILTSPEYSAILVELILPGMSGLELIDLIRQKSDDTLVIVITAHASIDSAVEATKRGAFQYLAKPFTPGEILLALQNGWENQRQAAQSKRLCLARKDQLTELTFERSKNKSILNCITDGVLIVNRQRQVVLSNTAAARIFSDLSHLPLPTLVESIISNSTLMQFHDEVAACDDDRLIRTREFSLDRGTYIVNACPVSDPSREKLGVVLVFRDITAPKKPHIAKAMFVSMAAKQVGLLLDKIAGHTSSVAEKLRTVFPEVASNLKSLEVEADALRRMFHQLGHLVEMEADHFTLRRCPISIITLLGRSVESVADLARGNQVGISVFFCESLTTDRILADREAMEKAFINIIQNAILYNRPGGTIRINVKDSGMFISVSIKDNGIGMTDEERERIFDVFYRARSETVRLVPGVGLGLSLVKQLVDLHQGIITCRSQPNVGTEFNVKLPKA